MRRYAQGTSVGVSRSREAIDRILREWGAQGVQWTDEFVPDRKVLLRFIWMYEDVRLTARFCLHCDRARLEDAAVDNRSGKTSPAKLEKLLNTWGSESHRLLLLFLKGAMFAVDAGLIKAEQIFMPFFEDRDGNVVGEMMIQRLKDLPNLSTMKLLPAGEAKGHAK
jgi:hypothetical protein